MNLEGISQSNITIIWGHRPTCGWIVWHRIESGGGTQSGHDLLTIRAHLHLYCPSIRARIRVRAPDRVLFTLHPRLGSEIIRGHGHFGSMQWQPCEQAAFGHAHIQPRTNLDVRVRGNHYICSDELGHGRPRQKFQTQTRISANTTHQFTCFDCVQAGTPMLGLRSWL